MRDLLKLTNRTQRSASEKKVIMRDRGRPASFILHYQNMAPNTPSNNGNALAHLTMNQLKMIIRGEIAPVEKKLDTLVMQLGFRQAFNSRGQGGRKHASISSN